MEQENGKTELEKEGKRKWKKTIDQEKANEKMKRKKKLKRKGQQQKKKRGAVLTAQAILTDTE